MVRKEDKVPFTKQKMHSIIVSKAIEDLAERVLEKVNVGEMASSDSGYGIGQYL